MGLYILPRFTEIESVKEFRKEVLNFYKTVMPYFLSGLVVIYFLRSFIVRIVFSSEFIPVTDLFIWQLLGDLLKVLSVVIAYQFLAKRMFWHYLVTEAFLVIMTYLTSIYCIDLFGLKGAVIGHFASYAMYFGLILLIFRSSFFWVDTEMERTNDSV